MEASPAMTAVTESTINFDSGSMAAGSKPCRTSSTNSATVHLPELAHTSDEALRMRPSRRVTCLIFPDARCAMLVSKCLRARPSNDQATFPLPPRNSRSVVRCQILFNTRQNLRQRAEILFAVQALDTDVLYGEGALLKMLLLHLRRSHDIGHARMLNKL